MNISLFPLNTVLYPGGPLPLRVFEPRYLDMVSHSMKTNTPIGVVLIEHGDEVGPAPEVYCIGTITEVTYWHKRSDGLLGITLTGKQRFKILESQINENQLMTADIELIENVDAVDIDEESKHLVSILEKILDQLEPPFRTMNRYPDDAEWVSARLIELLPTELEIKQSLLESNNVADRLARIESILKESKH